MAATAETVWLADLDLNGVSQGGGHFPQKNKSVERRPLTLNGKRYAQGLGTHAESVCEVALHGQAERFTAIVGVDDEVKGKPGSVEFKVTGDGKELFTSGLKKPGDEPTTVNVDIRGVQRLLLEVTDAGDGTDFDHADWAEAQISYHGAKPVANPIETETAVILTPKEAAEPRINGARIVGVRPTHPFLYVIAATGTRPMTLAADGLPPGLAFDEKSGIITGSIAARGTYKIALSAKNALGQAQRELRIVVGDKIALTPPMGWNSWNCFASAVTEENVKSAAKAMVDSGLIQHGWTFINVDDYWQVHKDSKDPTLQGPQRDTQGRILPNPRFTNMKGLTDYIHRLGLKAGIYSSPGPWTCGGCVASWQHEEQDAQSYAAWGFDYLKYDWCSYGEIVQHPTLDDQKKPYTVMSAALAKQNRDIVFSLCQYGMGKVWEWGEIAGGNCWRTTYDIVDTWGNMSGLGFNQNGYERFAGPGHWNDPDMLVVGHVGWGPKLHPTRLTPNEQYTHISLWCLLAAPLLIGCDMTQMDDFTRSLLTNDEVLDVNQDPLGQQAARKSKNGQQEVWAKVMEDGSLAVGLFNRGVVMDRITVTWSDLGLSGKQRVRDLWRQQDIGVFADQFAAAVPRHGVVLLRVWPAP
ncbi:MAG: alpha-galactosidase [Verrucomicrobia bacterium]|nr:MAG: alpha-galactosidase [Verrucomicrobiota bacterium]